MAEAGREQGQARFVYVTRFGSHQCGGVLKLRGRRAPGLIQKDAAKKFAFPMPLNETSKILKKKKKVAIWNTVYKVISRMLEENEKYRLRLKCQGLSSENSDYTR